MVWKISELEYHLHSTDRRVQSNQMFRHGSIRRENRIEPRIEPCGSQHISRADDETRLLSVGTENVWYDLNQFRAVHDKTMQLTKKSAEPNQMQNWGRVAATWTTTSVRTYWEQFQFCVEPRLELFKILLWSNTALVDVEDTW